jgi:hypothetical protein
MDETVRRILITIGTIFSLGLIALVIDANAISEALQVLTIGL